MKPPKCRACGEMEWRHVCGGVAPARGRVQASPIKHVVVDDVRARMSELGKVGGKRGGAARAKKLSPERRIEIARAAAKARWGLM